MSICFNTSAKIKIRFDRVSFSLNWSQQSVCAAFRGCKFQFDRVSFSINWSQPSACTAFGCCSGTQCSLSAPAKFFNNFSAAEFSDTSSAHLLYFFMFYLTLLLLLCQYFGWKHACCFLGGHVEDTKVLLGVLSTETVSLSTNSLL